MRTVWVFGDSFSVDFENNRIDNFELYKDLKGYFPKSWGKIFSEELGYEYRNFAQGGWDNYSILQSFCENISYIKTNDIVFVGWAPEPRIRLTDENGNWRSFNVMEQIDWGGIDSDSILNLLLNRVTGEHRDPNKGVEEERMAWENMIKFVMKDMILHIWLWNNNGLFMKYQTINNETNGTIPDGHWSENGHKNYCRDLMKELKLSNKFI
jgi:hypothetical protein